MSLREGDADRDEEHAAVVAQALKTYFAFLELRHKAEIYQLTGRVAERPVDEMNPPRGGQGQAALRIPLEAGRWSGCSRAVGRSRRRAGSSPRRHGTTRLMAEVGLRVNKARCLDLPTCGGSWAGSRSCTSGTGRELAGRGRGSGWCR